MTDISDVFLFPGSLEELNSIDPAKQYELRSRDVIDMPREHETYLDAWFTLKEEVQRLGAEGAIRVTPTQDCECYGFMALPVYRKRHRKKHQDNIVDRIWPVGKRSKQK